MKPTHYLALLLSAITFYNCEETSTQQTQSILPLNQGNWWVYEIKDYDSAGTMIRLDYDTLHVISAPRFNGEQWYGVARQRYRLEPDDTVLMINRADGLWKTADWQQLGEWLLYKHPTAANDTFSVNITSWPDGDGELNKIFYETFALQQLVTIPLGAFTTTCYKEHWQVIDSLTFQVLDDEVNEEHYVAPGVGLIKKVSRYSFMRGAPDSIRFEHYTREHILKDYRVQ